MLLKIVYGAGNSLYITDIKSVSFVAHHSDDAEIVDFDKELGCNERVVFSEDYLRNQVGCSPKGEDDRKYYMNSVCIYTTAAEPEVIFFTGTAYLCDDTGKTVDTLR